MRDESGLLTGFGVDEYGFMHLGFQEYLAASEIRRRALEGDPGVLRELARHFGESWWQEVILVLVALGNPSVFEPLMREVVRQPAFATDTQLLDLLLEEASEVSLAPFLEAAVAEPGSDPAHWARQRRALGVLERLDPEAVEPLAEGLRNHPSAEIRALFAPHGHRGAPSGEDVIRTAPGDVELVLVPSGRFLMGSPTDEEDRYDDEGPQHRVDLDSFYLGRYAVTNEEYGRYLAAHPEAAEPEYWSDRRFNGARQPVVGVSWEEARAFAAWAGCRLPTESEWEYACRAGTTTPFSFGENISPEVVNYDGGHPYRDAPEGLNRGSTVPVGSLPANGWGLHEMHGNVWEWVEDDWHGRYEAAPVDGLAWVDRPRGAERVVRGGSWHSSAGNVRAAYRYRNEPEDRLRQISASGLPEVGMKQARRRPRARGARVPVGAGRAAGRAGVPREPQREADRMTETENEDYRWDVFVSYCRGAREDNRGNPQLSAAGGWVQEVFYPELERWMEEERPGTTFFIDTALRTGRLWPQDIQDALRHSRCMLAVWSAPYFQSDWCRSEWQSMVARQRYDEENERGGSAYVFPVVFWDGRYFDEEAKETQQKLDLKPYSHLRRVDREGHCAPYRKFIVEVRTLCRQIGEFIDSVPDYDPGWPLRPVPGLPNAPFSVPRNR